MGNYLSRCHFILDSPKAKSKFKFLKRNFYRQKAATWIFLILLFLISGCKKVGFVDVTVAGYLEPGIVLTFDDNYYDSWIEMLPILDKYNAKATFFISPNYPAKRKKGDLQKILTLYNDGHEIGSHTMNHPKINIYLHYHNLTQLYEHEILPVQKMLDSLGIKATSFAYPYGYNTAASDSFLGHYFNKIRTVANIAKSDRYVDILKENQKFMDGLANVSKVARPDPLKIYKDAILKAKTNSGILVLLEHKPVQKTTKELTFSYAMLDSICRFVTQHNMRFYRMQDI